MSEDAESDDREEYERLLHFVRRAGPRFGLALSRYTDPVVARSLWERAIVDLAATGQHAGLLELHHHDDQRDLVRAMLDAISDRQPLDVLFVVGMDRLLQDSAGRNRNTASITNLNLRRDELPEIVRARVVFWVPHTGYPAFAKLLRDIDEVLLTAFEFVAKSQTHVPPRRPDYLPEGMSFAAVGSTDAIRNQAMLLAALHDRAPIEERAALAATIANLHLSIPDEDAATTWFDRAAREFEHVGHHADAARQRRRLATALLFFGKVDRAEAEALHAVGLARVSGIEGELLESLAALVDVHVARGNAKAAIILLENDYLPLAERLEEPGWIATAWRKVADILFARGDLDEALHILRQELLPVFERLGDIHSRAVTLGQVADILFARGDLDEALRIRQEEELPVYERLGDVRLRAVTLGKVADILFARGDLDEALRIRQEEQLPVFERLGDVRLLVVGRANLAILFAQRGHPEDIPQVVSLLATSLADARRLRLGEVPQIEALIRKLVGDPAAPPFSGQP